MRLTPMFAAAAALLAAACSPPAEEAAAPAEAPAPVMKGREAAYAAARGEPEGFVRALYALYADPQETPPPGRDPLLGRTLNAMVGADHHQAVGEKRPPYLKHDFICDCDGGTVVLTSVQVTPVDRFNADAAVVFTVDGQEKRQTLKLVQEGMNWKVADVLVPGQAPLTERILKVID